MNEQIVHAPYRLMLFHWGGGHVSFQNGTGEIPNLKIRKWLFVNRKFILMRVGREFVVRVLIEI